MVWLSLFSLAFGCHSYFNQPDQNFHDQVVHASVVAIENANGQVLMLKRQGSNGEGTWSLVGGKVDPGESPLQAVIRETQEEVAMELKDPKLLFMKRVYDPESKKYFMIYAYHAYSHELAKINDDKASELVWADFKNPPTPLFEPGIPVYERIINSLN